MAVRSSFPILETTDLLRLEAFYAAALGAVRTYAFQDGGRDVYVALALGDGGSLGIGQDDDLTSPPLGMVLWCYVDDVDAAHATALAAGAAEVAPPEDTAWGERVAKVRDLDGRVVCLGASTADPSVGSADG